MDTLTAELLAYQRNTWRAGVTLSNGYTTAVSTFAGVPYDTILYDPQSCITLGVGGYFTCPQDGYYSVSGTQAVTATAGAQAAIGSVWRAPAATLVFAESHRGNYVWSFAASNGLFCEATVLSILCSQGDLLQFRTFTSVAMSSGIGATSVALFSWVDPA
jgi:hypothetical protein